MAAPDRPLLSQPDLMLAVLKPAAAPEGATLADSLALLRSRFALAHEPPADDAEVLASLAEARRHLAIAGLLAEAGGDRFAATPLGRRMLADYPDGIDDGVLAQLPAYRRLLGEPAPPSDARIGEDERGYLAYGDGRRLSDNPYDRESAKHAAWAKGWSRARDAAAEQARD